MHSCVTQWCSDPPFFYSFIGLNKKCKAYCRIWFINACKNASILKLSVKIMSSYTVSNPSPDHVFSVSQSQTLWFSKKSQPLLSIQRRKRYKCQRLWTGSSKTPLSPEVDIIFSFDTFTTAQGLLWCPFLNSLFKKLECSWRSFHTSFTMSLLIVFLRKHICMILSGSNKKGEHTKVWNSIAKWGQYTNISLVSRSLT